MQVRLHHGDQAQAPPQGRVSPGVAGVRETADKAGVLLIEV